MHPVAQKFLDDNECSYDDLSTLTEEQYAEFKKMFLGQKPESHRNLNEKWIDLLYNFLLDVLAKKQVNEKSPIKVEQI